MRRTKPRGTKYAHVLFGEELARRSAMYKFRLGWVVGWFVINWFRGRGTPWCMAAGIRKRLWLRSIIISAIRQFAAWASIVITCKHSQREENKGGKEKKRRDTTKTNFFCTYLFNTNNGIWYRIDPSGGELRHSGVFRLKCATVLLYPYRNMRLLYLYIARL